MSAATDNVGLFFGEDIFMAIGSILLIVGFLDQSGITVEPLHLSVWAIPTAIAAFLVHGARLLLFDRKLAKSRAGPSMIGLPLVYVVAGLMFAAFAVHERDRQEQRQALGQRRLLGVGGGQLPGRRLSGRPGQRLPRAGPGPAGRDRTARRRPARDHHAGRAPRHGPASGREAVRPRPGHPG
jgi:hypothetical protein